MQRHVTVCFLAGHITTFHALLARGKGANLAIEIESTEDDVCTATLPAGVLSKLGWEETRRPDGFILGRQMVFLHPDMKIDGTASPVVMARRHPLHREGLYVSTYSHLDVAHHLKTRTIAQKTGRYHIQMQDRGDAAINAIRAYHAEIRNRVKVNPPLLVYKVLDATPMSTI